MRQIFIILFLIVSLAGYGQSNLEVKNLYIRNAVRTPVWIITNGDSSCYYNDGDTTRFRTNNPVFNFNKPIYIQGNLLSPFGFISGPTWKASGGSAVPYANQSEAPKGAFYWGDNSLSGEKGLFLDTLLQLRGYDNDEIFQPALFASGTMNGTPLGYFENDGSNSAFEGHNVANGPGLSAFSQNGTPFLSYTINGFDHAKFGIVGDSITIQKDATIHQYKSGIEVIYTDTKGNAHFAGFVDSKGVYAVGRADSINYTVGGTQNIFYKINTGALSIKDTSWMFIRGDSIQVRVPGDYEVDVSMCATTANASDKLRVRLFVNNAVMSPALGRWMINSLGSGNQQTENCPFWYARALPYGAWLSVRIQNQTASRAINISDFGFNIKLRHK